jgi:hypothetical protein
MPSAQVSVWVPLVVALVGLGGVLGAQLVAGWREDRRWQREVQREELRWQREVRREQERRRHDGREDAYARAIGALEAWQWVMYPVKERVLKERGVMTDQQRQRLAAMSDTAHELLGPMNLHAPERVRNLMRDAVLSKSDLTADLLALTGPLDGSGDPGDSGDPEAAAARRRELTDLYRRSLRHYYAMRAAMRQDLGIDPGPADGDPGPAPEPYARR